MKETSLPLLEEQDTILSYFENIDDKIKRYGVEIQSENKFEEKISNSRHAIDLEIKKFNFGKNQVRLIYKQQQKWMHGFLKFSIALLLGSLIVLVLILKSDVSDIAIITAFIGIIIEIIALFSIMVKYTFSPHTDEFVKGIYKNNYYSYNEALDNNEVSNQ